MDKATDLAEAATLGAAMLRDDAAAGIVDTLSADAFAREAHRVMFEAIAALVADGEPVDTVTVTDRLASRGRLDEVGGAVAVSSLTSLETTPVPASWRHYCRAVAEDHDRRLRVAELRKELTALEAGR